MANGKQPDYQTNRPTGIPDWAVLRLPAKREEQKFQFAP